jgi:hypothetical protein
MKLIIGKEKASSRMTIEKITLYGNYHRVKFSYGNRYGAKSQFPLQKVCSMTIVAKKVLAA